MSEDSYEVRLKGIGADSDAWEPIDYETMWQQLGKHFPDPNKTVALIDLGVWAQTPHAEYRTADSRS